MIRSNCNFSSIIKFLYQELRKLTIETMEAKRLFMAVTGFMENRSVRQRGTHTVFSGGTADTPLGQCFLT